MTEAVKRRRRRSKPDRLPVEAGGQTPDVASEDTASAGALEAPEAVFAEMPAGDGAESVGATQARDGPPVEELSASGLSQVDDEIQGLPGPRDCPDDTCEPQGLGKGCFTAPKLHARYQDHIWNMSLVSARTAAGQPAELLTVVDGYTQECLLIAVERRMCLEDIIDRLFDLFVLREVPKHIILVGGSASLSKDLAEWLKRVPVETAVSGPESRGEDDGPGSFGARLRDEVLAGQTFATLTEVREVSGKWRREYNETRPQRSPLEDEPQAPQDSYSPDSPEADPAIGQALQPEPGSAGSDASEKWQHKDSWDVRWPKWAVYAGRAVEYVGIVLVFLLLTMVVLALLAPHFGWRADTVLSGSMEPALPVGSIEVTRPVSTAEIQAGDIITFRSPTNGALMSHRVAEVLEGESSGFRTKGDNNEDVDPYVIPAENVVGRFAFKVDHAGRVVEYLKTPLGFILLGLCGFALIAAEISTMLEVRWKEAARADTTAK